jgi:hypothetical protein
MAQNIGKPFIEMLLFILNSSNRVLRKLFSSGSSIKHDKKSG